MTAEQAIRIFDDHLVFLAGRKMINNVMLEKLKTALKTIAESHTEQPPVDVAQANATAETIAKMRLLLMGCGLTTKGIEHHLQKPYSYLEKWADLTRKKGITLNSGAGSAIFEMEERHTRLLAECDVTTVRSYQKWHHSKVAPLTTFIRKNNSHLERWFTQVDAGKEINEREIYQKTYDQYLHQWI
jgi:hypothetical protein